jgi:hypothetical protein
MADDFCGADSELLSGSESSSIAFWLLRFDLLVISGREYEFEDFFELVKGFSCPSEFL